MLCRAGNIAGAAFNPGKEGEGGGFAGAIGDGAMEVEGLLEEESSPGVVSLGGIGFGEAGERPRFAIAVAGGTFEFEGLAVEGDGGVGLIGFRFEVAEIVKGVGLGPGVLEFAEDFEGFVEVGAGFGGAVQVELGEAGIVAGIAFVEPLGGLLEKGESALVLGEGGGVVPERLEDEAAVVEGVGEEEIVFEDGGLGDEAAVGVERQLGFGGEPVGVGDAQEGVGDAQLIVERLTDGESFGEEGKGGVGVAEADPAAGDVVEDDAFVEPIPFLAMDFQGLLVFGDRGLVARLGGEGGGLFGKDGRIVLGGEGEGERKE